LTEMKPMAPERFLVANAKGWGNHPQNPEEENENVARYEREGANAHR